MIFEVLELLIDLTLAVWRYYNDKRKKDRKQDAPMDSGGKGAKADTERAWSSFSKQGTLSKWALAEVDSLNIFFMACSELE